MVGVPVSKETHEGWLDVIRAKLGVEYPLDGGVEAEAAGWASECEFPFLGYRKAQKARCLADEGQVKLPVLEVREAAVPNGSAGP